MQNFRIRASKSIRFEEKGVHVLFIINLIQHIKNAKFATVFSMSAVKRFQTNSGVTDFESYDESAPEYESMLSPAASAYDAFDLESTRAMYLNKESELTELFDKMKAEHVLCYQKLLQQNINLVN